VRYGRNAELQLLQAAQAIAIDLPRRPRRLGERRLDLRRQTRVHPNGARHALFGLTSFTLLYIIWPHEMSDRPPDHGLEFLLAFDGRTHHLEEGYWLKFEIKRVAPAEARPHGLSYSFTLHAPDGTRLVGFDNAHGVPARGSRFRRTPATNDHWHRTESDAGRPYHFVDADTLLRDFFREVRRVLRDRGIPETVVAVEEKRNQQK
jgi:Family of unknown function (DUF6516)